MPRTARIICPGIPHHVTQRGNRGQDIFLDDEDRQVYLRLLRRYASLEKLTVQAYCLMGNHLHLIVNPKHLTSLANVMHVVHMRYAQHANDKYDWTGHLFASRYYSCAMDDVHLWTAMRYVEQNPVRATMVQRAQDWSWSSAPAHCALTDEPLLDSTPMKDWPPEQWRDWLANTDTTHIDDELRLATRRNLPMGDKAFLERVAELQTK